MKRKVALVACSNPLKDKDRRKIENLVYLFQGLGIQVSLASYIFEEERPAQLKAQDRAEDLMALFEQPEITDIFDISGGEVANELIPALDFSLIHQAQKTFYGYSDLTTILNALASSQGEGGRTRSVLYQLRQLVEDTSGQAWEDFLASFIQGKKNIYEFDYRFFQGEKMEGQLIGGNVRCFLKLAGSPYLPTFKDKILFLEAYSGGLPQLRSYLAQLKMMDAFDGLAGVMLGTFSQLEAEGQEGALVDLVRSYLGPGIPLAKTSEIGHGLNSKALIIGENYNFSK